MPIWLVDFLVKFGWVVFKAIYPILLGWIKQPMSPEDQKKWDEVVRKGMTKEDVMDFQKGRGKPKPAPNIIIKENKPKPKSPDHKREK